MVKGLAFQVTPAAGADFVIGDGGGGDFLGGNGTGVRAVGAADEFGAGVDFEGVGELINEAWIGEVGAEVPFIRDVPEEAADGKTG